MELKDRQRSIDITKLTKDQADEIGQQLGAKVRQITDEAVEKANKILNIYGMRAEMQIAIKGINEPKSAEEAPKKKKGRPRKGANL